MPWLPIYANYADMVNVFEMLNADDDCAFIVSDGQGRWRAVSSLDGFADGRYCIWVHRAGPLPLLGSGGIPDEVMVDPWNGWTQDVVGGDVSMPYFGPGCTVVVWLNVRTRGREDGAIGLSSFEWVGNHFKVLENSAPDAVEKWWRRLGRKIKKMSNRIPRSGPVGGPGAEVWALSSALASISSGVQRDGNSI